MRILVASIAAALLVAIGYVFGSNGEQIASGVPKVSSGSLSTALDTPSSGRRETDNEDAQISELTTELAEAVAARRLTDKRLNEATRTQRRIWADGQNKLNFHKCLRLAVNSQTDVALAGFSTLIKPTGLKGKLISPGKRIVGFVPVAGDVLAAGASYYEDRAIQQGFDKARAGVRDARVRAERSCGSKLRQLRRGQTSRRRRAVDAGQHGV